MSDASDITLLVGDNPFHGISHLSQERARSRGNDVTNPEYAASLVKLALENGAEGFMFSASEQTLSIIETISKEGVDMPAGLYALVPYAYEYVRLAVQAGGISGLAKIFAKRLVFSGNLKVIAMGMKGVLRMNPLALLKTYLTYEISRINAACKKNLKLEAVLLHEIITDMSLALDMDWIFKAYIDFIHKQGITPGFESRNFAYLVDKFNEWGIGFQDVIFVAPFNKSGFQMNPSKKACEKALTSLPYPNTVAMSILASGHIKPPDAMEYVENLPNLAGVVAGVSKERHARETFQLLKSRVRESKNIKVQGRR